jgi:hypothetical protein
MHVQNRRSLKGTERGELSGANDRDEINLHDLTKFQQKKLTHFYEVDNIDDLDVDDEGNIIVKHMKGSGASSGNTRSLVAQPEKSSISVYLEDYDKKLFPLSIDDFINNESNLAFQNMNKDKASLILSKFINEVLSHQKKNDEINQLCIEHIGKSNPEYLLFQQFIIFYSNKLKKILCGDEINKKYIKATGNPAYSDVDFYNIIKKSNNELILKGFAFCGYPNKSELYINIVCGTGGTSKLVGAIEDAVRNKKLTYNPKYITLESIETEQAIKFYTKLGFRKPKKDAIKTITSMINSKAKTFQEYADANPIKAGGKLYLFPHNEQGEKMLKKFKCEWIYTPVKWFDQIQDLKQQDSKSLNGANKKTKAQIKSIVINSTITSKLEGDGIGDFFKKAFNKGKELINKVADRFKPKLNDFTNQSKKTLGQYGDWRVINMYIQRKPIMGILDKFFNVLTFGKFEELKNKYGYDKLFHLQLGMQLWKDGQFKKVVAEKNETVDITEAPMTHNPEGVETLRVIIPAGKVFTLNDIINQTRQRVGDYNFFSYDPFTNNCQFFIKYLLETMGMYGEREKSFLYQDMAEFQKELPSWLPKFARGITDLGATVSNVIGKGKEEEDGYELHAVIFKKKKHDLDDATKKAKEIIKGNKHFYRETKDSYRFRNIAKQKFDKSSFRTKVIDDGISLIFGKIKDT